MISLFSWQNSISLFPASFFTPRSYFPVIPGISWLPTFAFQSLVMKRTSFFGVNSSMCYRYSMCYRLHWVMQAQSPWQGNDPSRCLLDSLKKKKKTLPSGSYTIRLLQSSLSFRIPIFLQALLLCSGRSVFLPLHAPAQGLSSQLLDFLVLETLTPHPSWAIHGFLIALSPGATPMLSSLALDLFLVESSSPLLCFCSPSADLFNSLWPLEPLQPEVSQSWTGVQGSCQNKELVNSTLEKVRMLQRKGAFAVDLRQKGHISGTKKSLLWLGPRGGCKGVCLVTVSLVVTTENSSSTSRC